MNSRNEKPAAGYRGSFVYQQEYGYMLITLMIHLHTPDEQSIVCTRASGLDIREEAEHLPSGSPLAAIDLYHFAATDGTEIFVTIKGHAGEQQARYLIHADAIEEDSPFLWLTLVRSSESVIALSSSLGERGDQDAPGRPFQRCPIDCEREAHEPRKRVVQDKAPPPC
jgi:hypothetical protein